MRSEKISKKGGEVMTRIEKSIEIKVPPEKVWELLALDRFQEWEEDMQKGLKSFEYTSEVHSPKDKYQAGTSGHMYIQEMGGGDYDFQITESLENEKLTYNIKKSKSDKPSATGIITLLLKPIEGGTHFTYIFDYELPWGVFGRFLDTLFAKRASEKAQEKWLQKLKSILEN
jgi:uncharacterized protein YndB with AHSA1/START domain